MDNIFFNKEDLKSCGENVIIGKTVRIRRPELVSIGDNVIIDDFTYISCAMQIGNFVHISPNSTFAGGINACVYLGNFVELSSGLKVYAGSNNYSGDEIACITVPAEYRGKGIVDNIILEDHVLVGANTVILPGATLPKGMSVGALSLVKKQEYKRWTVYAGNPIREIGTRDHNRMISIEKILLGKK